MQLNWALETRVFDEMVARTSAADRKAFFDLSMEPRAARPKLEYPVDRGVALFDVMGVLSKDGPDLIDLLFGEGGTATAPLADAIGRAADDPSVLAIFIDIDSPGGTVDGTAAVADAVYAASQKKPVFAFAGDCIASAAYWIGSQATKLFVGPTSTVGSIGVYTVLVDSSRLAANQGIDVKVVKSGEMKGAGTPGTPITDAQVADTQRVIDDLNGHFVAAVARGRGMRMKHERNADGKPIPADGRVFIGQQAVDMGLADGVMDRSAALSAVSMAAMAVAPGRTVIRAETETIGNDLVKVVSYSDGTTEMSTAAEVAINKKENRMANNIAKTLGLAEDATEEQIAKAISDREQRAADLASKVAALEGTVNNLASQADKILSDQLNKRIAEIDRKNKIEALVKSGVIDGKITTKQRASALELATAAPEAFESFLRDFVAVAPVKSVFNSADVSDEVDGADMNDPDSPDTRAALFQEAKRLAAKDGISQAAALEKVFAKHDFGASVQ